ncbi:hypothetical protein FIBSPDRAFT_749007, partial [Athelia psychrophila]
QISCKECRRLKLKCDKKVPCGSCQRRGCASICPNGNLSLGQGTRFILADTDQLHKTISDMASRIRQLEDALAVSYAVFSPDTHPLLRDEFVKVKFGPPQGSASPEREDLRDGGVGSLVDALGTLTLDSKGQVTYYGRSAGSEAADDLESARDVPKDTTIPRGIPSLTGHSRISGWVDNSTAEIIDSLYSKMPPYPRAVELASIYHSFDSYMFPAVSPAEISEILVVSYLPAAPPLQGSSEDICCHRIATAFFVLAIGALFDPHLPPYNAEAKHYYNLGCTALSLRSIFEAPQMSTVHAVVAMGTYHYLAGDECSRGSSWTIIGLACKLAQGVYRDSARWGFNANTVQQRRKFFWDLVFMDALQATNSSSIYLQSLAVGRPPTMDLAYADCEFPVDEEETLDDAGEVVPGQNSKYMFIRDIFHSIVEVTLVAKTPSYESIMEVDRKMREAICDYPYSTEIAIDPAHPDYHCATASLRDYCQSQCRSISMLYLHRSFFAEAFMDGLDPAKNPQTQFLLPSCLAAYRASSTLIDGFELQFRRCPEFAIRLWPHLMHVVSASIVIGSLIVRSPNTTTATSGIEELSVAVKIFEKAAVHSSRGRAALNVVRKMRNQAVQAVEEYKNGLFSRPAHDLTEDELCLFGGQTRLLDKSAERCGAQTNYGYGHADLAYPPLTDDFGLGAVYGGASGPSRAPPIAYQTRVEPPMPDTPTYDMFLPRYEPPVQIFIPEYVPENPTANAGSPSVQSAVRGEANPAADGHRLSFMRGTAIFDGASHGT